MLFFWVPISGALLVLIGSVVRQIVKDKRRRDTMPKETPDHEGPAETLPTYSPAEAEDSEKTPEDEL